MIRYLRRMLLLQRGWRRTFSAGSCSADSGTARPAGCGYKQINKTWYGTFLLKISS